VQRYALIEKTFVRLSHSPRLDEIVCCDMCGVEGCLYSARPIKLIFIKFTPSSVDVHAN
jgi:hypothetical protein